MKTIRSILNWVRKQLNVFLFILSSLFLTISVISFVVDNYSKSSVTYYYKSTLVHLPDAELCNQEEAIRLLNSDFFQQCTISLLEEYNEYSSFVTSDFLEEYTTILPSDYYGQSISFKFQCDISPEFVDRSIVTITSEASKYLKSKYKEYSAHIDPYFLDSAIYQIKEYSDWFVVSVVFFSLSVASILANAIIIHVKSFKKEDKSNG